MQNIVLGICALLAVVPLFPPMSFAANDGDGGRDAGAALPVLAIFAGDLLYAEGNVDGSGPVVRFNQPHGVATDSVGNLYIADSGNHTVRKITPAGVVSTFAGTATATGSADGVGTAASFNLPYGITTDSADNIYVADRENHTIRKITPAGVVSTFAGAVGAKGSEDGVGAAARFHTPLGLSADSTGNVYVVDGNSTIRKITPAGVVSTFAGKAYADGSEDGIGATARFYHPNGVATDHAGNVYVADRGNHTIRKITPDGVVSTFAGTARAKEGRMDGVGAAARFFGPTSVATDRAGNVYVVDVDFNYEKDNTIRKITPAGVVSTFAGPAAGTAHAEDSMGGVDAAARFRRPTSVATDRAGNVYVVDRGNVDKTAREKMNSNIHKITAAGVVSTFAGTTAEIKRANVYEDKYRAALIYGTEGVATDSAGNVYVASGGAGSAIRKITPDGVVSTLRGQRPYHDLRSLATDSAGNVYTTETFTRNVGGRSYTGIDTIRKTTPSGAVSLLAGESAKFNYPDGVAVDSAGIIYVADSDNHRICKITPRRFFGNDVITFTGPAGDDGSADGTGAAARFSEPRGVTTDSADNIYVTDRNSIRKITPAGVATTFAGDASSSGSVDGHGVAARFNTPLGVATDRAGNVYLSDSANHTIRKITPAGVVSTFAGKASVKGSDDGAGAAARFNYPYGVATDREDNLYVADASNSTIRKITSAGVVSTFAGKAGVKGSKDGAGAAARFDFPQGVAVDSAGNIYIADRGNYTIRKITPQGVVSGLAGADEHGNTDGIGAAARFSILVGVAIDNAGNVYVADSGTYTNTIRKITPAGVVSTFAGAVHGNLDDVGTKARFGDVKGVAIDSVGNVYVTDESNGTIRKITPAGVVSTFAGIGNRIGSADGVGTAARFNNPRGVATDNADNVYVADSNNHTIRKITPAGVVSTFAGTAGANGSADGIGAAARFNYPGRMATDSASNVYVVDSGNHTIRKITPTGVVSTLVGKAGQVGFVAGALPGVIGFPKAVAVHGTSLYITMRDGVAVVRNHQ